MLVTQQRQLLHDGDPIEELTVEGSRFDRVSIRLTDDSVVVRARQVGTDTIVEERFEKVPDKLFKPVTHVTKARRDVDDDIQDALASIGYATVDGEML